MPNVDEALKMIISARDEASSVLDVVTDKIEAQNKALTAFSIKLPLLSKAVTAALAASTTMVVMHTEALKKMGLQADISYRHMTELEKISKKYGIALEDVVGFQVRMKEIATTQDQAESKRIAMLLKKEGIIKDVSELLEDNFKVMGKFGEVYRNAGVKSAFFNTVQKNLGVNLRNIVPLLKTTAVEMEKVAAVDMGSEKDQENMEAYAAAMKRMQAALSALNKSLARLGVEGFAFIINTMAGFVEILKKVVDSFAPLIKVIISVGARLAWLAIIIGTTLMVAVEALSAALTTVAGILSGLFLAAVIKAGLAAIGLQVALLPVIGVIAGIIAVIGLVVYALLKWKGTSADAAESVERDFDRMGEAADRASNKASRGMKKVESSMTGFNSSLKKSRDIFGETMEQLYNLPEALGLVSTMGLMKAEAAMKISQQEQDRNALIGSMGGTRQLMSEPSGLLDKFFNLFNRITFNVILTTDEDGEVIDRDVERIVGNIPSVM